MHIFRELSLQQHSMWPIQITESARVGVARASPHDKQAGCPAHSKLGIFHTPRCKAYDKRFPLIKKIIAKRDDDDNDDYVHDENGNDDDYDEDDVDVVIMMTIMMRRMVILLMKMIMMMMVGNRSTLRL
ncbi:hypothetical protein PoB_005558300 [Plakobranchus ocellatus]|uniref:Uncharacterized protein n=1 Tax=Plakobranchus ocellatus TaxID=259542 RepID=A0AAV4CB43_9GAST|nr:hypothetical protein PoB_005558300 [Plakobranchus ocellatus]